MANRNVPKTREKQGDEVALEDVVQKRGHHVTGLQLGNLAVSGGTEGDKPVGQPPLTEQEKRNRAKAKEEGRPSVPSRP